MSAAFLELERVEARVLGAIRLVDVTTATPISRSLDVRAAATTFQRNRSGLYVIREAAGFAEHTASFDAPPPAPAVASVTLTLTVADPLGAYLPRSALVALPRDPDPANATGTGSLFRPVELPMFPSPAAAVSTNWAVLRISLTSGSGEFLGGALLRVLRGGNVLARGLTDWRGEALLPVAGVPVTTFAENGDAVVISEIEVVVQALFDPAVGSRSSAAAVRAGQAPVSLPIVNPATLENAVATLPRVEQTLMIAARRMQSLSLSLALP